MATYRKLPVTIHAWRVADILHWVEHDRASLPQQLRDAVGSVVFTPGGIHVHTLEGNMFALPDDMLICGVAGELYSCKPDIFFQTYEPV